MEEDSKSEKVSKIRFIYIQPEERSKHFINGAIGGLTPRGEILCNFFFEYKELPDSEEAAIEDGDLKPLKALVAVPEIIRDIKCGIIVNSDQARKIAEWFVQKADEHDKLFGGEDVIASPKH